MLRDARIEGQQAGHTGKVDSIGRANRRQIPVHRHRIHQIGFGQPDSENGIGIGFADDNMGDRDDAGHGFSPGIRLKVLVSSFWRSIDRAGTPEPDIPRCPSKRGKHCHFSEGE
nr:hypothetical protein [Accumulibacter sp.]